MTTLHQALTARVDRLLTVKRTWRPLQAVSRALIVGTFVDDFVRIASDYTGQADSMRTVGFGDPLSAIMPALFCAVQGVGTGLVLLGHARFVQIGSVVLIAWSAAHPFLYQQRGWWNQRTFHTLHIMYRLPSVHIKLWRKNNLGALALVY